ncbi:hypothetical protein B808_519 [Fructilactobacillus florum 8D]|uniref:Uncharacterized protein n=1 Tax=Fructilactobacillus florum 8D TaxID=1221538 RepID=W9EHV6_9LACO|nr:hypothetical protein B807_817 [Fructilactobacillus florum 2F]ETO40570.1 hypothetical protein B808_519 [Fructilactobacillus florum 8D]
MIDIHFDNFLVQFEYRFFQYRNNSNRSLEEELEEKTSKVQRKIDEIDTEI